MQIHLPGHIIKNITDPTHYSVNEDGHLCVCIPLTADEITVLKNAITKENSILSTDNTDKISDNSSILTKLDLVTPITP